MTAWFIPPIIVPLFFAAIIFSCALNVIYAH
jgi:hypothetical protein